MLTIAIPTFERAELLDRQLAWLAGAVEGHEDRVELVVSDNCSSDGTQDVTGRWQRLLGAQLLEVRRQPRNIGAIRNIRDCLVQARQRHVWAIGDDDVIDPAAVGAVLDRLSRHPDLALLNLNFSSRSAVTGELLFERCYDIEQEQVRPDGAAAFAELLARDYGGVALTTAQIYRSDLMRGAVAAWGPRHEDNLVVQIFWTGWCASRGDVLSTRETFLECSAGNHFFVADPMVHLRLGLADMPELAQRLEQIGYPRDVLDDLVVKQLARHQLGVLRRAVRQDPAGAAAILGRYLQALRRVGWTATAEQVRREAPRPFWRRLLKKAVRTAKRRAPGAASEPSGDLAVR